MTGNDHQVQPNSIMPVTTCVPPKTATPRVRSGLFTFLKRSDKMEYWQKIGRETQRASLFLYISYSGHSHTMGRNK